MNGNPNLVGGDCVSGSHHLDQQYFFRPLLGWSPYQAPIQELYLTGASTLSGGRIHGALGYLAAHQVLPQNPD